MGLDELERGGIGWDVPVPSATTGRPGRAIGISLTSSSVCSLLLSVRLEIFLLVHDDDHHDHYRRHRHHRHSSPLAIGSVNSR